MAQPQSALPTGASPDHAAPDAIASADEVIQLVRSWIETAKLKEGDRLPTERALAEQFGLNRNLVRRAFMQLERLGLINRHVGRGTFVGAARREPTTPASVPTTDCSPAAIIQARLMIEPGIAALAVANSTMSDLRNLDELAAAAAEAESKQALESIAIAFQQALAAATHNNLIAAMAATIASARASLSFGPGDTLLAAPEERTAAAEECQAILAAMRARDPGAAAQAARRGLIRSTRTFSMLARMELLPDEE